MMRRFPAPSARDASTKSCSFAPSTAPRTTRAKYGISAIPTAMTTLTSPTPSTATMRIESTMDGKPNITSMIREPRASTRPPVKPMKMPKRLPRIAAKSTVAMPTDSEKRPP